jgi:hypothetical protein
VTERDDERGSGSATGELAPARGAQQLLEPRQLDPRAALRLSEFAIMSIDRPPRAVVDHLGLALGE